MDAEFDLAYHLLYDIQTSFSPAEIALVPGLARTREDSFGVRVMIDSVEREFLEPQRMSIRSDGKCFLLSNIMSMLIWPIRVRTAGGGDFPLSVDLAELIRGDLITIAREAVVVQRIEEEAAGEEHEQEISGHSILQAVVRAWSQLGLSKVQVWGRRQRG